MGGHGNLELIDSGQHDDGKTWITVRRPDGSLVKYTGFELAGGFRIVDNGNRLMQADTPRENQAKSEE